MNRKRMRKSSISWLLVLSMVLSLFGGEFASPLSAKADGEATITFGDAKISSNGYYTYPDLTVTVANKSKRIHNLTVKASDTVTSGSSDSGYIRVTGTTIEDYLGKKITGKGILTKESLDEKYGTEGGVSQGSSNEELSTDSTSMYESITFDFDSAYGSDATPQGALISEVQSYLRTLRFTTSEDGKQEVSITATTLSSSDMKVTINEKKVQLHYYNGHFYGYVPFAKEEHGWETGSWQKAYEEAQTADFNGVTGYLATLTSRGEDRFLYSTFPLYGNYAKMGWIGCTRMSLADVEAGKETEKLPAFKGPNDPNFVWRWVSGPEKGLEFGQQIDSCGYGSGDGGFEAYAGCFSNWENGSHVEPNGGTAMQQEGFGYYGQYEYGRWNDWPNDATISGYYIEFGGMLGDDQKLKDSLGEDVIISGSTIEDKVVNPNVKEPESTDAPKETMKGKPAIRLRDGVTKIEVGTQLIADVSNVTPDDADYVYKWYYEDKDTGVWKEISTTNDRITLTGDLIDHNIKVELVGKNKYEGSVVSSDPFDATHTKKPLTGSPSIDKKNSDDELEPGTVLVPNLDKLVSPKDSTIGDQLEYTWVAKNPETGKEEIVGTDKSYVIKEADQGKDLYLTVKAKDNSDDYTGEATSQEALSVPAAATPTPAPSDAPSATPAPVAIGGGRPVIENDTTDEEGNDLNKEGTVLTANIDKITPEGAKATLTYQWSIRETDGTLTKIEGATGKNYTLRKEDLNKDLVVSVTADEDSGYYGTRRSFPYTTTQQRESIKGTVGIINETTEKDANGDPYEVKREGTILTADIDGVTPEDSHDSLTYQWGIWSDDGKFTPIEDATDRSYRLTTDEIDKKIGVKVTGNGSYKGTIDSSKYDTTRTDSDVKIEDSNEDGKRLIVVSPTMEDTVYAIVKASGDGTPLLDIPTVDEHNIEQHPTVFTKELPGYYRPAKAGGKLIFTVDKNEQYIIYAKRETTTDVVIVAPEIDAKIGDYDDKNTLENNEDDTISVVVNPADPEYKYGIMVKKDGKYTSLGVTYDPDKKEYVYDKSGNYWSGGGEGKVIFSNLPADGTYKVVAVRKDATVDDGILKDLTPEQIEGGSPDIISEPKPVQSSQPTGSPSPSTSPSSKPGDDASPSPSVSPSGEPGDDASPSPSVSPSNDPNAGKSPAPSGKPSASPVTSPNTLTTTVPAATSSQLTPDQISRVDQFVEDHGKDSTGDIVKKVDDLTKDIISSGEKEWNEMSSTEQDAVNQRLKDGGCPYTYSQLLELANAYKIPGFKLHKVMKKGSKAKLKMMKCKGATVIVTSTNKKVATVNKKGVIKAKKKGKATLTITAVKGKYSNRLVVKIEVRKKFKNATELKKFKSGRIKTPTILIAKKRKLKKSTKIKIYGLEKSAKVKYVSYNKKALPINKKGRYTAKKKGKSLMRVTVKQNDKTYFLYLYVTAFK